MNETAIIKKVLSGDADAYSSLVARYHVGLIIHCQRFMGEREDAEDIAQDAFIKAFNNLPAFNPDKAKFSTWLYKIATNTALDSLRKQKRFVPTEDIEQMADIAAPDYEAEETKRTIRDAVHKLRPSYRQVIEAYYWRGETYEQIANNLNIPINSVRTRLHRAKQQLRSDLS
jgi:RNA polymerase sigma-70 factor (ECF subfamily)